MHICYSGVVGLWLLSLLLVLIKYVQGGGEQNFLQETSRYLMVTSFELFKIRINMVTSLKFVSRYLFSVP